MAFPTPVMQALPVPYPQVRGGSAQNGYSSSLLDGLVFYFPGGDAPSGVRNERVGAHNFTDANTVPTSSSSVLFLPKVDDYTDANDEYLVKVGMDSIVKNINKRPYTLSCWVRLDSLASSCYYASARQLTSTNHTWVLAYLSSTNRMAVFVSRESAGGGSDISRSANDFGDVTVDEWMFVQVLIDIPGITDPLGLFREAVEIEVNRVGPNRTTLNEPLFVPDSDNSILVIGSWFTTSFSMNGYISSMSIHDRILTEEEKDRMYNGGLGLAYPWR